MAFVDAYSEIDTAGLLPGEKPWLDLVFDLTECAFQSKTMLGPSADKFVSGAAVASTERGLVGFNFESSPVGVWSRQDQEGCPISWGQVTLTSSGIMTVRLVEEMASWFELQTPSNFCPLEIGCMAVIIGGDAADFGSKLVSMKLFFQTPENELSHLRHDAEDPDYAEIFLNIDLQNRRAWLKEKDPDYRSALVRWFSGRTAQ